MSCLRSLERCRTSQAAPESLGPLKKIAWEAWGVAPGAWTLSQVASGRKVTKLNACMKVIRERARADNEEGDFIETALDVLGRSKHIEQFPSILKQVETFAKKASHPTKGLLGKRGLREYEDDFQ